MDIAPQQLCLLLEQLSLYGVEKTSSPLFLRPSCAAALLWLSSLHLWPSVGFMASIQAQGV